MMRLVSLVFGNLIPGSVDVEVTPDLFETGITARTARLHKGLAEYRLTADGRYAP